MQGQFEDEGAEDPLPAASLNRLRSVPQRKGVGSQGLEGRIGRGGDRPGIRCRQRANPAGLCPQKKLLGLRGRRVGSGMTG